MAGLKLLTNFNPRVFQITSHSSFCTPSEFYKQFQVLYADQTT